MPPRSHNLPQSLWPALGLLALVALNAAFDLTRTGSLFSPGAFLHIALREGSLSGHLIDILHHASPTIILALGMTLVIATRGVDLSVGSIMAISGATATSLIAESYPPLTAITAALTTAFIAGAFNGALVSRLGIQPIVATLILMVAGRGIAQMITAGQIVTFQNPTLTFLASSHFLPIPFLLAITLFIITAITVRKSALGLLIEAVGSNPTAAYLSGVRSKTLIASTYIFCSLCAALAGLIDAANIKAASPFHSGMNAELAAIFAVVVGGTSLNGGRFSLAGSVIGGLLIQALTSTMYARDVRPEIAPLPQAIVILAVCLLSSGRLVPRARSSEPPVLPTSDHPNSRPRFHPTLAALVILLALFLFGAFRYDYFASLDALGSLVNDYAFVGIAAIGATLVILSGGIDLTPGAVIACSSILISTLISRGVHPLPAFAIALTAGSLLGTTLGFLIHRFQLPAFMVTLAGMFAARAAGFLIHPQSQPISHPFYTSLSNATLSLGPIDLSIGSTAFLIVLVLAWLFLSRTPPGRAVYALGGNERSARIMGVRTARTRILTYTLAGLCSALAGCAYTLYQHSGNPASTIGLELDVIASVVIGGTLLSGGVGTIWGTLIGVLTLALIRRIIDFEGTLSAAWTSIATGLLLLVFVALQRLASRTR